MALLSLDTDESIYLHHNEDYNQNSNKRSLESSTTEQIFIKRRHQKTHPSKFSFF